MRCAAALLVLAATPVAAEVPLSIAPTGHATVPVEGSFGVRQFVLDTGAEARDAYLTKYGVGSIPMNYVLDRSGVVVDAWVGFSKERTVGALRKAGLTLKKQ